MVGDAGKGQRLFPNDDAVPKPQGVRLSFFTLPMPSRITTEQGVHDPTAPNMRPWLPAMVQDFLVRATSIFQDTGEFGHPVESTLVVNGLGQRDNARCQPRGVNGGMREAVAENFSDQPCLGKKPSTSEPTRELLAAPAWALRAALRAAMAGLVAAAYQAA